MRMGVGYGVSVGQRLYNLHKHKDCCLKRGLNVLIRQNDDSRERHCDKNLQRHFYFGFYT